MGLLAKIIQLDNAGHPDEEVILICNDFYELRKLLLNPKQYMGGVGLVHYSDSKWTLKSPVTAVIIDSAHEFVNAAVPTQGEYLSNYLENNAFLDDANGGFVAHFAKETHTLYIQFTKPTTVKPNDMNVTFTRPHGIRSDGQRGTFHFDMEKVLNPDGLPELEIDTLRANFIVDHLAEPKKHTIKRLQKQPKTSDSTGAKPPNNTLGRNTGSDINLDVDYQLPAHQFMIVEGLSLELQTKSGGVVVCTQSGMLQVADNSPVGFHWELNGMVVKNYVEP